MQQDEYLLQGTAIYTRFKGVYRSIYCNMPLNAVRFGAKRKVKWCKMQCVLPLNAVRFGAKRKVKWCKMQCILQLNARQKSIKIHHNGINITLSNHDTHG